MAVEKFLLICTEGSPVDFAALMIMEFCSMVFILFIFNYSLNLAFLIQIVYEHAQKGQALQISQ